MVFARTASAQRPARRRSSTATSAIARASNAPPPDATPSRTRRRSSASGAAAARTSTTSTSAGCGTCSPSPRRTASPRRSTPRRFSRCRRAAPTRRSKRTTTSGRRSPPIGSPTTRSRDGSPLIRVYPGVVYGPGALTEGNLVGRLIARSSRGTAPRAGRTREPLVVRVRRRRRGRPLRRARARRARRALRARRRERAAARVFEIVQQITGRTAAAPDSVSGRRRARRRRGSCASTLFGGTPLITRGAVEIFRHDWSLDSSEAVRDLGYTMTPLAEGIARTESMRVVCWTRDRDARTPSSAAVGPRRIRRFRAAAAHV